jgi:hypothetical protein
VIGAFRRLSATLLGLATLAGACSSGGDPPDGTVDPTRLEVMVASYDVVADLSNRFIVGLLATQGEEQRFVSFGTVAFRIAYRGTAEEPVDEPFGDPVEASFLPVFGTPERAPDGERPITTLPSEGRGVYAAYDLSFDRPGFYEVEATAEIEEVGTLTGTGAFEVRAEPRYPAPGEEAIASRNPTLGSGHPPEAVDSRAQGGQAIPDPELHGTTITRALREGIPALVVFSTPVFCVSQFCGPVTDMVQGLAERYGNRAAFIHVEVWNDFRAKAVNEAAADWLLREGDLNEPWLFLIGSDGTIVQRWDNLFTEEEVVPFLESLPPLPD